MRGTLGPILISGEKSRSGMVSAARRKREVREGNDGAVDVSGERKEEREDGGERKEGREEGGEEGRRGGRTKGRKEGGIQGRKADVLSSQTPP